MHTLRRRGALTAEELQAALADYVVVDVRDLGAWRRGHIAGALHLSVEQLGGDWPDPDPRLPVAVFADDQHSARAAVKALQARGRDAVEVTGGSDAWRGAGRPFVTNPY